MAYLKDEAFKTGLIVEPYVPVLDSLKMQGFWRICRVVSQVGPDTAALLVLLPREGFRIESVSRSGCVLMHLGSPSSQIRQRRAKASV